MPYGYNLSICNKCGDPFICGDFIEFICPNCEYDEYLKKKENKPLDPKDYKTTWGSN